MNILVLGAGLMGRGAVFDLLRNHAVTRVTIADRSEEALASMKKRFDDPRLETVVIDAADTDRVEALMRDADGTFCAMDYGFNAAFTRAAITTGTHMVDLGGNNDVVAEQFAMSSDASGAGVTVIPDCGLAPGMVSVLVAWGVNRFAWADTVRIRVGGLPLDPREPFRYERLFSVEGLINEYVEPPVLLRDGRIITGEPLGDVETVIFDEPVGTLEAFNTSGGISTLPQTYRGRLRNLDYKTLRYPGHAAAMRWLYHLGLFSSEPVAVDGQPVVPRSLTADRMAARIPLGDRDRSVVRVEFAGDDGGQPRTHRLDIVDAYDSDNDLTSMMRMTAFPAAVILQMICDGRIRQRGVLPQEIAVDPDPFVGELLRRGIGIKGI
ncbi:MAG TPA: saccharopine dehydrogenase C-terminal domain-containing protein [Acidobacteriota bacterium]|nr:saccharopine dehydrogenase C-terminal domain-containing protein [Acidobacteriota bacterium]